MSDLMATARKYQFWLAAISLLAGSALLVVGGMNSDAVTQTAGGSIIAAVIGVLSYQKVKA